MVRSPLATLETGTTLDFDSLAICDKCHRMGAYDLDDATLCAACMQKAPNKYHAERYWSDVWKCWFHSKGEGERGEELYFLQEHGRISDLERQVPYALCSKPLVRVILDFRYFDKDVNLMTIEDWKGVMTDTARLKYIWLHQRYNISVRISGRDGTRDFIGEICK